MDKEPDFSLTFEYQGAPMIPFFSIIIQRLDHLLQNLLKTLAERKRSLDALQKGLTEAIKADPIGPTIALINSNRELLACFKKDFITHCLRMPNLKSPWMDVSLKCYKWSCFLSR